MPNDPITNETRSSGAVHPAIFVTVSAALAVGAIAALGHFLPILRELRTAGNIDTIDRLIAATYFITFAALIASETLVYAFYRVSTSMRRHERSLHERHERLLRATPAAVLVEQDDKIAYANEAAARMFGAPLPRTLVGRTTMSLVHPDRRVAFAVRTAAIKGGMESGGSREKLLRIDGAEIDADVTATVVDLDGSTAVLFAVEDVTARLAAQAEARRGQERFALLTKATNDVIYDWNILTDSRWWNENYGNAFGRDNDGPPGDGSAWERSIHPDDRRRTTDGLHAALSGDSTFWAEEYRYRKVSGAYADIYDRGYIMRDESGRAIRLVGAMVDLTERRVMTASLTEARTLLEKAQEVAHVGSWHADPPNGSLVWSDEVFRIFGASPETFDGKVETFFALVHPDDREPVRKAYAAAIDGGPAYDLDHRVIRPDGTMRWVHERAEIVRDAMGKPLRAIGVVQDITDRMHAARQTSIQFNVALALNSAHSLTEARPRVLDAIIDGLAWQSGAVWLVDENAGTAKCAEFRTRKGASLAAFEKATRALTIKKGEGLIGATWKGAELHSLPDAPKDASFLRADAALESGLHGAIAFPIIVNGQVEAVYEFFDSDVLALDDATASMCRTIASYIAQFVDRLRANVRAEESARYARAIIDNSLDVITVLGPDGSVQEESLAAQRVLGYAPKDLVGKSVFPYVHKDDLAAVQAKFAEIVSSTATNAGRIAPIEFRFLKKDGTWAWFESIGVNLMHDPAVNGIIVSSRDITDRRATEADLKASEDRYHAMLLQAPLIISVYDEQGLATSVNPAWEAFWGDKAANVVGKYNIRKDTQIASLGFGDAIERAYAGEQISLPPFHYDPKKIGMTGEPRWLSCRLYPVVLGGKVAEMILMAQDVTDRLAYASQSKEKAELARRILLLTESTDQGIVGVDTENKCTFLNAAAARMLGYRPEELLGAVMHDTVHHKTRDGKSHPRTACPIANAYTLGETARGTDETFWRKDGSSFPVEYAAYPVKENGRVIGATVTFFDIGERIEAQQRISALDILRSKVIQIVSQQFRVPLDTVRWNLRTLLEERLGPLAPAQREFMRLTADANDAAIARIRDLLTSLDIEEGRVTLTPETVSIESICGSVMTETKRSCDLKGLSFEYSPPAAPIEGMRVDGEKIRIAMSKIADNATVYTPTGGTVHVRLSDEGPTVRFSVTDTGIGIPAAERARVFERFYRCSNAPSMRPDASGIGLTIMKHFVELHGGTAGFESTEGAGSTFWFTLPKNGVDA